MLKIDLEPGQAIEIGDIALVRLESKSGKRARLSVKANKSVPVTRIPKQPMTRFARDGLGVGRVALH